MTREVRVCSDQELLGLLNGRESRRGERVEALLERLRAATQGVNARCDIEVVVRVVCGREEPGYGTEEALAEHALSREERRA